jgi:hypothetical protein
MPSQSKSKWLGQLAALIQINLIVPYRLRREELQVGFFESWRAIPSFRGSCERHTTSKGACRARVLEVAPAATSAA